jgi:hypothetical protein
MYRNRGFAGSIKSIPEGKLERMALPKRSSKLSRPALRKAVLGRECA